MRRGTAIAAAAIAVFGIATAPATAATDGPRPVSGPKGVTITVARAEGSGCQTNTVHVAATSVDAEAFALSYGQYFVQADGSSKPSDLRKTCMVTLTVQVPPTFSYAISETDHLGDARLVNGAKATLSATHHFPGRPRPEMITHSFAGPYDDGWTAVDRPPADSLDFLPCGEKRSLLILTQLQVDKGTADPSKTNYFYMGGVAEENPIYHLTWKRCP